MLDNKSKAYTYRRYMRDGSVKEMHAVSRSRSAKQEKKNGK